MVSAVILAGGRGTRMNSNVSKQYINIHDKPMIYYTIKCFMNNSNIDNIILVLPKDEIAYCNENVIQKYNLTVDKIVQGGEERCDSVFNALNEMDNTDLVLIHDGARPFVSNRIINNAIKYAMKYKAAAPGVMPKDTIKIKNNSGFSVNTPDRSSLVAVQTPQAFEYSLIYNAHKKIRHEHVKVTDDTMVVEYYNQKVYLFDGEYTNIKITTPEDLVLAEHLA